MSKSSSASLFMRCLTVTRSIVVYVSTLIYSVIKLALWRVRSWVVQIVTSDVFATILSSIIEFIERLPVPVRGFFRKGISWYAPGVCSMLLGFTLIFAPGFIRMAVGCLLLSSGWCLILLVRFALRILNRLQLGVGILDGKMVVSSLSVHKEHSSDRRVFEEPILESLKGKKIVFH